MPAETITAEVVISEEYRLVIGSLSKKAFAWEMEWERDVGVLPEGFPRESRVADISRITKIALAEGNVGNDWLKLLPKEDTLLFNLGKAADMLYLLCWLPRLEKQGAMVKAFRKCKPNIDLKVSQGFRLSEQPVLSDGSELSQKPYQRTQHLHVRFNPYDRLPSVSFRPVDKFGRTQDKKQETRWLEDSLEAHPPRLDFVSAEIVS